MSNLSTLCANCGEPEGLHSAVGSFCREGDWYSSTLTFQQSTTGILDVAARNDGLSCSTVTYGATGGEVEWIPASPLQSLPVPLGREGVSGGVDTLGRFHGSPDDDQDQESGSLSMPRSRCAKGQDLPADSQILPEPFTLQQTGATASTSLSVVPENFSCFIERIDEFVAVRLPRIADCFCGRPSVHECPCGEPICANHSYDSLCGTCTEVKQLQQSSERLPQN